VRRRAVLMGGPAGLAAVTGLVLTLGALGGQQASGSVRIPVSVQMEHELIMSAHTWLGREGVKVRVGNISIVNSAATDRSIAGPLAAFVAEDHRFYGSACLTLRAPYRIPAARPGELFPSPLHRWPLCVLFSSSSPGKSWVVQYTAGSNCGTIGVVLRGLWGSRIPVCRIQPAIYQL
jgi:hypothetical protein